MGELSTYRAITADEGDAGKAYDKRAADVLEDLLKGIKDFTNCFQVYYLHLRLFVYVQSNFNILIFDILGSTRI